MSFRIQRSCWGVAILASLLTLGISSVPAQAARGLALGFSEGLFQSPDASLRSLWLERAASVGGTVVRVDAIWSAIAPTRPANPADPNDPAYRWSDLDASVRSQAAAGMRILATFLSAPSWAEGSGRATGAPAGTWRPDVSALGAFAHALASRYSGAFPDPSSPGQPLPAVRYYQPWNEPNLPVYLTPQWTSHGSSYSPASPAYYRAMLNAAYAAIKKVSPSDTVVAAGTAPYGDTPGGQRVPPALFVRSLLCLGDRRLALARCPDPVHFDVLDHHPYSFASPSQHALNIDDVIIPDLARLTRPLSRAVATGRVLPRRRKPLWVTEISWDTRPPDPHGVPIDIAARWLEQSFYLLWRQRVSAILWLNVRDEPPIPDYATTNQSGVFYLDGTPKPGATAFRFPLVAARRDSRSVTLWGIAPADGQLVLRQQSPGGWRVVAGLAARRGAVFLRSVRLRGGAVFDAQLGGETSLSYRVG